MTDFYSRLYGADSQITFFESTKGRDAGDKLVEPPQFVARLRASDQAAISELIAEANRRKIELFHAACPQSNGRHSKETALASSTLYCDVDHPLDENQRELLAQLDAAIVGSGGVGRQHVYVRLRSPLPPAQFEAVNRAFARMLEGEKYDLSSLLRAPETANRKRGGESFAAIERLPRLAKPTSIRGIIEWDTIPTTDQTILPIDDATPLPHLPAQLRRMLTEEVDQGRRSEHVHATAKELVRLGLTPAQIARAMADCAAYQDKFGGRPDQAAELRREIEKAVRAVADEPAKVKPTEPDTQGDEPADFESIWDQRKILQHIRDFARARRVSPAALFGAVLVRVAAATPPNIVMPPIVGSKAGLNFFSALVDSSGGGKTVTMAAAAECLLIEAPFSKANLGSAEGIHPQYRHKAIVDEETKRKDWVWHNRSVIFVAEEIGLFAAMKGRSASPLVGVLTGAWSGTDIGFAYAAEDKRWELPAHSYRLCFLVGVQPARAQALREEHDSGLPQRFMWWPANDPHAPDARPEEVAPRRWFPKFSPHYDESKERVVEFAASVAHEIDQVRKERLRKDLGWTSEDTHRYQLIMKVAALLALLEGRFAVTEDDWRLAKDFMKISDQTRAKIGEILDQSKVEEARQRGRARADERQAETTVLAIDDATALWAMGKINELGGETTNGELKRRCPSNMKDRLTAVLKQLTDTGQLLSRPGKRSDSLIFELNGEAK